MHYLKCTNCGHFNEVKTEYLTFCKNCNKVLKHNFSDWKKANPDKSFDDFKLLICTTNQNEHSNEDSKTKKSRGLKYWVGFTIIFALLYVIGQFGGEKIASFFKKPAFDKNLMEIASELNKTCPVMLDSLTRLDNSIALPNKVFQYNYSLITLTKGSIDIERLKAYITPRILNDVKTNPGMKFVRDNKVTVNYSYKDMNGEFLFLISVKPEDYE